MTETLADAGGTQGRLGAEVGITNFYVCDIENGRSVPSWDTLELIAAALDAKVSVRIEP